MKAVLMSIQPRFCELIASGKKTVEVRKTKPKLEVPFKVYIYETNWSNNTYWKHHHEGRLGKVIGEFVCHMIGKTLWTKSPDHPLWVDGYDEESCLTNRELYEYSKGDTFYEWHISNLVIYDKPRELGEFKRWMDRSKGQRYHDDMLYLQNAPQSWCYVEEVTQ